MDYRQSSGCNGYYYIADEPSYFNDVLSSTRAGFSSTGCNTNLNFDLIGRQGYVEVCTPDCPSMQADKVTSSKQWQR